MCKYIVSYFTFYAVYNLLRIVYFFDNFTNNCMALDKALVLKTLS